MLRNQRSKIFTTGKQNDDKGEGRWMKGSIEMEKGR